MKKVVALLPVEDFWRPLVVALACMTILVGLLTFRLGALTPGFSETEQQQRAASATSEVIIDNPLHLHQKLGQFGLQKLDRKGPAAMRLPSIIVTFAAVISMFIVLKNWYTLRVALLGTFLFATSSWLLHTGRLGTTDINYVLPLILLAGGIWLHKGKFVPFATFLTLLTVLAMLYVPGMIWFILPLLIWQRRVLRRTLRRLTAWQQIIAILVVIVGLGPLVWAFVFNTSLLATWMGAPSTWPGILDYLRNIPETAVRIFIRGSGDAVYGIGRLALLDAFTAFMVILGMFVALFRLGLDRTRVLIASGIISILLIALDGPVKIAVLMPVVYILAAGGIALLLQQWFTVFPRNPVARILGVVMVTSVVLLSSYYHLNHYFIAWPNVPATKQAFSHQP